MPIYADVEGIGKLEFPDGTDPAVIDRTVKRLVGERQATASKGPGNVLDNIKDSWVGGAVRGLRDPIDAGAQLVTRGLEAVAPSGSSFEKFMREQREDVERVNKEAEQDYTQNWRRGANVGMDIGRIGGNIAATALLPVGQVGTAASMPGRALQAARAGGILGLLQPVNAPQSAGDFWSQKAGQGVVGAAAGGVLAPVAEIGAKGATKLAGKVAEKGRAAVTALTTDRSDDAIREILRQRGIDVAGMAESSRKALIADVRAAMGRYGGLDPKALARRADFAAQGVDDPLKAWVTRDPVAFTETENLAGIKGVGDSLTYAKSRLNESLKDTIARLRPAGAGDEFPAAQEAVRGIVGVERSNKAAVDALYDAFRKTAPDVQGNGVRFVDRVSRALDDEMVGGQLPSDFVTRLQKIAAGEFPLTPSTLYQMQKAASAQGRSNPALGIFKKAVDDELMDMGAEMGPRVGLSTDLLSAARTEARKRFMAQEAIPALKAAADGTLDPDRFFAKYIQGGTVNEVAAMWGALKSDVAAKNAIRAQVADLLRKSAIGSSSLDEGVISQAGINKVLGQSGMKEKLRIVLGKQGLEDVERVARLAENAIKHPAAAKVNTSNTASALANLLNKVSVVPLVGQEVRSAAQQMQAAGLAKAGPASIGRRVDPWTNEQLRESTRRIAGLLAGTGGLLASGNVSR